MSSKYTTNNNKEWTVLVAKKTKKNIEEIDKLLIENITIIKIMSKMLADMRKKGINEVDIENHYLYEFYFKFKREGSKL
jgi:uncharacterized protein YjgD (DUF1641 family)